MTDDTAKIIRQLKDRIVALEYELENCKKLQLTVFSNLIHEIRTPLNGILGFSEIISEASVSEEERKHYGDVIVESSNLLLNIISDVIDITKLETGQYKVYHEYFDLNDLMAHLYQHYKPIAEKKGLQFFLENVARQPLAVWSDREAIEKVLRKLIDNAIKFTKEGWVKLFYREEKDLLQIFVEDTGLGIPLEIQDALFTRFTRQQVSQSRNLGGTGIDLSLCYGMMKALGGHIFLNSSKGNGSTFRITLGDYQ
ncbi:MAG TPA: HAMP domain-containing sensor histidine kinase [Prolixibacteraceae bacterium]|nr:HAMP domain-containing sensor histidine kinase [Prolixibacteraceae bacterium]